MTVSKTIVVFSNRNNKKRKINNIVDYDCNKDHDDDDDDHDHDHDDNDAKK